MFEAHSLSCRRSGRLIFSGAGFRLAPGDFLQVNGANGSGKSSLLRLLAGFLPCTDGEILWQSRSIADDPEAHKARIDYIGHLDAVKPELTGDEMIAYWRTLRGRTMESFEDAFGITSFRKKPVRFLSAGQKRRLALTRLMLSDATIWLLDEPTAALDREGQNLLAAAIAKHRAKGGIVIAAMHHVMETTGSTIYEMARAR